jgi:hypothetical protein
MSNGKAQTITIVFASMANGSTCLMTLYSMAQQGRLRHGVAAAV